jgi:hypothetical protein
MVLWIVNLRGIHMENIYVKFGRLERIIFTYYAR